MSESWGLGKDMCECEPAQESDCVSVCAQVRTPEDPGEWECEGVNTHACVSTSTALGFVCLSLVSLLN